MGGDRYKRWANKIRVYIGQELDGRGRYIGHRGSASPAHRDDEAGLGHLVVDLSQSRSHLVRQSTC